jgi:predicted nucleotidyltransferase
MSSPIFSSDLKQALVPVFKNEGCDFVLLGGSQAAGTAGWWSDVDIFIHVQVAEGDEQKVNRILRLAPILAEKTSIADIDLHDIDTLPVHVQFNVIRGGIVLYEADDGTARANFVEKMLHEYYEIGPWYESIINERLME